MIEEKDRKKYLRKLNNKKQALVKLNHGLMIQGKRQEAQCNCNIIRGIDYAILVFKRWSKSI